MGVMSISSIVGLRWFERRRDGFDLRLSWAEISGGIGLAFALCLFDEHYSLHVRLGWPNIFIRLPILRRWHREPEGSMESWGFTAHWDCVHLNWGRNCKIVHMPWSWEWVRTSYLLPDGYSWIHDVRRPRRAPLGTASDQISKYSTINDIPKWSETHPYRYVLRSGAVQDRKATIKVSEMEWRWRWLPWAPLPRMLRRTIDVEFSDEVGERSGSWKGGCVGCGYDMYPHETPREALQRMEVHRKF